MTPKGKVIQCKQCSQLVYREEPYLEGELEFCDECLSQDTELLSFEDEEIESELIEGTIENYLGERCPDCGQFIHGEYGCVCS
jgi:hypothetical protein